MNLQEFKKHIINKQSKIVYESDEDEGAAEYYGELQSIIDRINKGSDEKEIRQACDWVGEKCYL